MKILIRDFQALWESIDACLQFSYDPFNPKRIVLKATADSVTAYKECSSGACESILEATVQEPGSTIIQDCTALKFTSGEGWLMVDDNAVRGKAGYKNFTMPISNDNPDDYFLEDVPQQEPFLSIPSVKGALAFIDSGIMDMARISVHGDTLQAMAPPLFSWVKLGVPLADEAVLYADTLQGLSGGQKVLLTSTKLWVRDDNLAGYIVNVQPDSSVPRNMLSVIEGIEPIATIELDTSYLKKSLEYIMYQSKSPEFRTGMADLSKEEGVVRIVTCDIPDSLGKAEDLLTPISISGQDCKIRVNPGQMLDAVSHCGDVVTIDVLQTSPQVKSIVLRGKNNIFGIPGFGEITY